MSTFQGLQTRARTTADGIDADPTWKIQTNEAERREVFKAHPTLLFVFSSLLLSLLAPESSFRQGNNCSAAY
jgi:hypothetical protein